jgi:hypothetical protein
MTMRFLRVMMCLLAVFVSRCRVLFRLVMLPMSMVMGSLKVMVRGGVMARGRVVMMLDSRVLTLFGHDCNSSKEFASPFHSDFTSHRTCIKLHLCLADLAQFGHELI